MTDFEEIFYNDSSQELTYTNSNEFWQALIVDDEKDVHTATELALDGFEFEGKQVSLDHAYSSHDAINLLSQNCYSLILIDVVMENNDSGLELVKIIRNEFNDHKTRLVLRTGEPLYAPEDEIIRNYDINDFRYKTELTSSKLRNIFYTALRSYRDICDLESYRLSLESRIEEQSNDIDTVKNELKALTYAISHDFRTPVRTIEGLSKLLLKGFEKDSESKNYGLAKRIKQRSNQMTEQLNALLSLFRSAESQLNYTHVNLSNLAYQVMQELMEQNSGENISFSCSETETVLGDEQLLNLMLLNLLQNAVKYSSARDSIEVRFGKCDTESERLNTPVYFINDNGIGFDMSEYEKLFSPFSRLETARNVPGSGIGLATTLKIVNRHGGKIWAESELGNGATFYFTLKNVESQ